MTAGGIFARCWMGQPVCHYEEAIADKDDHQTLPCSEALEIVKSAEHHRSLQMWSDRFWPQSTVCYNPIGSEFNSDEKQEIMNGIADYHTKTNLKFISLNNCSGDLCGGCQHGIKFFKGDGCTSVVGYAKSEEQKLSLAPGCFNGNSGTVIHELGHAVGLFHSHQQPGRNLVLLLDNIGVNGPPGSYKMKTDQDSSRMSDYDSKSVMHYGFGKQMCVPKGNPSDFCDLEDERENCKVATEDDCDEAATEAAKVNRKEGLSPGDVAALKIMYPNAAPGGNGATTKPITDAPTPAQGNGKEDNGNQNKNGRDDRKNRRRRRDERVCNKDDEDVANCCSETNSCGVGEGDCDSDDECLGDLRCGRNNCEPDFGWGGPRSDCCYEP